MKRHEVKFTKGCRKHGEKNTPLRGQEILGLKNNEKLSNCKSRETLDKLSGAVVELLVLEILKKGWTKIYHK